MRDVECATLDVAASLGATQFEIHAMRIAVFAAFCLSTILSAGAPPALGQAKIARDVTGTSPANPDRFGASEQSYVVWHTMRNNHWATRDDSAARAHFSLKYSACSTAPTGRPPK